MAAGFEAELCEWLPFTPTFDPEVNKGLLAVLAGAGETLVTALVLHLWQVANIKYTQEGNEVRTHMS